MREAVWCWVYLKGRLLRGHRRESSQGGLRGVWPEQLEGRSCHRLRLRTMFLWGQGAFLGGEDFSFGYTRCKTAIRYPRRDIKQAAGVETWSSGKRPGLKM